MALAFDFRDQLAGPWPIAQGYLVEQFDRLFAGLGQVTTIVDVFTGDLGTGGVKGLVPGPVTGDASKFLKGDGTWGALPGAGTVTLVSVTTAAGVSGTVATATTTPAITITLGTLTAGATGAGFTIALTASTVTGTLADARLSTNIPLLNAATNAFTGLLRTSKTLSLTNTGGAAASGQLTLVAGTKTVNTTAATATALIFFQRFTAGGTVGFATTYTVVANTSFTVSSDNAGDTSVFNWWIVETY